jgi:crotonobetainyl-CoA:carnitine CoA-transferase CaiB-like acyl-CoA transferase
MAIDASTESQADRGQAKQRPLQGVRIIDVTSVLMGPAATQILADYGADVIKVESPGGDIMRHAGEMRHEAMGHIYLHANRNKRSIVIDLKKPDGREALLRLAATADMFIHNVRPSAMERLGLDYAALAAVNPRIIYVALVGYDQQGPYAALPAMDDVIQGASGIAGLQALYSQGPPTYVPLVIVDRICAVNAAQVILAALFMRERTGRGQQIEVPMFETIAQIVMGDHLGGETFDPPAGPMGYTRLLTPHRRPFKTRDGYIALIVYTDRHWQQFFDVIGRPQDFAADPRFTTAAMRGKHHDVTYALLTECLLGRTTAEWVELLQRRDIPCLPLHDLRGVLNDPHLAAVDFFTMMDHPSEGRVRTMRVASTWSDAELSIQRHAPRVGEQSVEILREAGFSEERIERLLAGDAVAQAPV